MPETKPDLCTTVRTARDFSADQVISALQKEIRRGHTENATLLACEMMSSSKELEDFLWKRLMVISVEDVGFGEVRAPILVNALHQMVGAFAHDAPDRGLFAVHAVRYLCRCRKDRSSDEMLLWTRLESERGGALPEIPDYALDMHTAEGKRLGRGLLHFMEEGARVDDELPDRDTTYRKRVLDLIEASEGRVQ